MNRVIVLSSCSNDSGGLDRVKLKGDFCVANAHSNFVIIFTTALFPRQ